MYQWNQNWLFVIQQPLSYTFSAPCHGLMIANDTGYRYSDDLVINHHNGPKELSLWATD